MANRFYIVPRIGTGIVDDEFKPKYFSALTGVSWSAMPFGKEPFHLVVSNLTPAQHTTLVENSDVVAIPENIEAQVGTNRVAVVNALEVFNIPAGWVTTAMTYRFILKIVCAIFQFAQRLHGHANLRIYESGITMSTQFRNLPENMRTSLLGAAQSMNFDTSSLSGTFTIRQILKAMADQWGTRAIHIGGFTL